MPSATKEVATTAQTRMSDYEVQWLLGIGLKGLWHWANALSQRFVPSPVLPLKTNNNRNKNVSSQLVLETEPSFP